MADPQDRGATRKGGEPHADLCRLFDGKPLPVPFIGRPYLVWKNDLALARRLNDQLARCDEH